MENKNIGLFVGNKQIALLTPGHIEIPVKRNIYVFYFKRGNRAYFKNDWGRLSVESSNIGEALEGIKYGTEVIIDFGYEKPEA